MRSSGEGILDMSLLKGVDRDEFLKALLRQGIDD
jgi:hypothetical protein